MIKNLSKSFICLFVYLFLFHLSVYATEWVKHPNNPVLSPSANKWDSQHVASPAVIYENNQFKMWYQGIGNNNGWSIGLATSTDGVSWQKYENNPLLTPANESNVIETGMAEPAVTKTDIYRMWYNSQNNQVYEIRLATSTDGIHWQKHPGYVLTGQSTWEAKGVSNPSVIYKDGKFIMVYTGWGYSSGWKIGIAESTDGINWTKLANNPLSLPSLGHVGGQSINYQDGKFHLWYHTGGTIPSDIYHVVSTDKIHWNCEESCLVIKSQAIGFDGTMSVSPEVIFSNNKINLWYGGFNNIWQIGLATKIFQTDKPSPIVIIPGLFASWNKQALIYIQPVNNSDWRLNPSVREYDGLKQTLTNLGYQENQDFFIYAYDWRKGLNNLADDLNDYLQQLAINNPPAGEAGQQFSIIGHSLGGLVARIYAQKYGSEKINKLITVGSPHHGVAQVYKAVEAGEIERFNNTIWLTGKFLLQLYKDGLKTDKQIINEKIPIIKDLLPTNNFLKNKNNQEILISDMTIKNDTLLFYNPNLPNILNLPNLLQTIVGEKGDTLAGYQVSPRNVLDQLFDNYPDGRPIENFYQIGDYTVLSSSAQIGNNKKAFNFDHGEIIYKKEAIKEILNLLALPYQENQIVEGSGTKITPSLLFLILSPAEIKVIFNNNTYIEHDGLIFIENALSGDYQLQVQGKENGNYQVLIGQIGENSDQWSSIYGSINKNPPTDQTDSYQISFNKDAPSEFPFYQDNPTGYFNYLVNQLTGINAVQDNPHLKNSIKRLIEVIEDYQSQNLDQLKLNLEKTHNEIFKARKDLNSILNQQLSEITSQLEYLYHITLVSSSIEISPVQLNHRLIKTNEEALKIEQYLLNKKNLGEDVSEQAVKFLLVKEKLEKAEKNLQQKNYFYTEILLQSCDELIKEIK